MRHKGRGKNKNRHTGSKNIKIKTGNTNKDNNIRHGSLINNKEGIRIKIKQ